MTVLVAPVMYFNDPPDSLSPECFRSEVLLCSAGKRAVSLSGAERGDDAPLTHLLCRCCSEILRLSLWKQLLLGARWVVSDSCWQCSLVELRGWAREPAMWKRNKDLSTSSFSFPMVCVFFKGRGAGI